MITIHGGRGGPTHANCNDYLLKAVLDCLIIDPMFVIVTFSVLLVIS